MAIQFFFRISSRCYSGNYLLLWLRRAQPDAWLAATSLASLGLLALASAVDYPLRSPAWMVFAILLVGFSLYPSHPQQSDERR